MATETRQKALQIIDRIYNPIGGMPATAQLELSLPIQLVHDVSRESERNAFDQGPGCPGYFQVGQDNVHAGASTIATPSITVYGVTDAAFGAASQTRLWCWLMYAGLTASASVLSDSSLCINIAPLGGALALRDFHVAKWVTLGSMANVGAHSLAGLEQVGAAASAGGPFNTGRLPMLIPAGSTLGFYTVSTGAGTLRLNTLIWCGPIGSTPPGMM